LEAEKVLRRVNSEGLAIPLYLGELIHYFTKNVRKLLYPKRGVLGLWITGSGTVVGVFSFDSALPVSEDAVFTKYVRECVCSFMPEKNMGPADFRRLLPTIIFKKNLKVEGKSLQEVLGDYANLVNTSVQVDILFV
jgi:hypothetical protein